MKAVLPPGTQRVPSKKLDLFIHRNFLTPDECAALIALIETNRRPSTIADSNGDPLFRTSETCDLDGNEPIVAEVAKRIAALLGIDPRYGEAMQGQRYAVGQEFKAHTDYFEPGGADYWDHCTLSGQRTWTAMIYLDEPTEGGATRFKSIDKIVQPETGKLLTWNNLYVDGRPNPATIHHGMKVRKGVKHIITQWYRQKPWPNGV